MSRFVSAGGSEDQPTAQDEAWLEAQKKIEATRQKPKPEIGQQEGGKSLFDTLQANKAAKQDAFEEASRLRNQFRSLDEDEVEFLDSVMESTRSKEAEVKKETRDQLEAFRKQQEEAEKAAKQEGSPDPAVAAATWAVGSRKRKKGHENQVIGGVKLRRTSKVEGKDGVAASPKPRVGEDGDIRDAASSVKAEEAKTVVDTDSTGNVRAPPTTVSKVATAPVAALGLAAYSSDEDD